MLIRERREGEDEKPIESSRKMGKKEVKDGEMKDG